MDNNIEKIWKEGFTKNENLDVPILINFYNQKSKHLITRIKNTMYSNNKGTIVVAFTLLVVYIIFGQILTGCIIFAVCTVAYFIGKKQLISVEQVDFGTNSYEYLKNFYSWWQSNVSKYSRVLKYLLPLIVLMIILLELFNLSLRHPIRFNQIINDSVAIYIGLGFITFVILIWVFSVPFYKKILDLIYGKEINKLRELINDMEELRASE
ncbi:hypothetical protein [Seonamhaeicola sp. ML3]|uniref:hypothetical protein n=1 Tax=Seonamhaeicola sp. ML3 TaxID=2937786 RepID=UPI00200DB6BF|nr:hypothetical protein [Seonamhaeicola sp. ML3]